MSATHKTKLDAAAFWKERLSETSGLEGVGHRSLGAGYNAFLYQRREDVLDSALEDLGVEPQGMRILDVGCGTGHWIDFWRRRGVRDLSGIDLFPDHLGKLAKRYPEFSFVEADITMDEGPWSEVRPADLVTAFDVLYHIVDDARLLTALASLARLVKPNGRLLVFDQLLGRDYSLQRHVKYRSRDRYAEILRRCGLQIAHERPLFRLLAPPVLGLRLADYAIHGAYKTIGAAMKRWDFCGRFVGQTMYDLDRWLDRHSVDIPNQRLLVIERATRHTTK